MVNNGRLRIASCGEHQPESGWLDDALRALGHEVQACQDGTGRVDAVLLHDPAACDRRRLAQFRADGAVILLRAYRDPEQIDDHRAVAPFCDVTLTSGFADCVDQYRRIGASAVTFLPASPPSLVSSTLSAGERPVDLLFAGRLDGNERRHRRELIERAAKRFRVEVWAPHDRTDALDVLHRRAKLALHWDRLALNLEGITRGAPGTRPFAGPAAGCVLATQLAPWMAQCYDIEDELAGFADVDHALEVVGGFVRDPVRLARTAAAGRARCLAMHTYRHRALDLVALVRRDTPLHLKVLSLAPWYQRIELPGGVATSLMKMSNVRRWERLERHLPEVRGRRVVDFGANAGFFSLKCLERGAAGAVAIDRSALACLQAQFVVETLGLTAIQIVQGDVAALSGRSADLVLMLAVLHHHADIEPLLRAVAQAKEVVLEWHVREQPFHHPIEKVTEMLQALGHEWKLCEGGERPIVVARRAATTPAH